MIKTLLLIGIGGGTGSILRYLTSLLTAKYFEGSFPLGTFIANIVGCLLIGIFLGMFTEKEDSQLVMLFVIGFCGGYTTFSSFAYENLDLLQSGNYSTAFLYIAGSVLISLFAVWVGLSMVKA